MRQVDWLTWIWTTCSACNLLDDYLGVNDATISCRQAVTRDPAHDFAETIQLGKCRVEIWRDAQSGEFFVHDRRGENMVLTEKVAADLALIQAFDLYVRDVAHLIWIERSDVVILWQRFLFVYPVYLLLMMTG